MERKTLSATIKNAWYMLLVIVASCVAVSCSNSDVEANDDVAEVNVFAPNSDAEADDDATGVNITPEQMEGQWWAGHQTKNPNLADTCDTWDYTFGSNGTGTDEFGQTFKYEINGSHVTLKYQDGSAFFGRTMFEYTVVSYSQDHMKWDEVPDEEQDIYGTILSFFRKE